jgi:hypothetical protein
MAEQATEKQIAFLLKRGVDKAWELTKQEASAKISELVEGKAPPTVAAPKPFKPAVKQEPKSMYVSYAKDIFCKLCDIKIAKKAYDIQTDSLMTVAIKLVEQAKKGL